MQQLLAYVNDRFVALQDAVLPVNDLGLQRGYGVFDFFRAKGARPLFLQQHLDRLFNSMAAMRLTLAIDRKELEEILATLLQKNNLPYSGVRITVTGGASADGYSIAIPHLVIAQQAIATPPQHIQPQPYKLITHQFRRQFPDVKTTDYLQAI